MAVLVLVCDLLLCAAPSEQTHRKDLQQMSARSRELNALFLAYKENDNTVYLVERSGHSVLYDRAAGTPGIGHHAFPTLSPDGKRVAFVRRKSAGDNKESASPSASEVLAVLDLQDKSTRDVLEWEKSIYGLAWSPDGREIAMVAENPNRFALYVVSLETSGVSELTSTGSVSIRSAPSWSPDGKRLAFAMAKGGRYPREYEVFAISRSDRRKDLLDSGKDPQWSPQGDLIAYLDQNGKSCYVIRPDGSGREKIFGAPSLTGPLLWSRDGNRIGFHQLVGEGPAYAFYIRDLRTRKSSGVYSRSSLVVAGWYFAQ